MFLYIFLVTIECGLVLLTRVFNVFTLTKCYTCNTIHHKKSLYFFVVEKNDVHKNVKCSRFKCPYCKNMLGYLSLDIICSSKLTVFLELRSRKTVGFSEQIMSADKYPSIFSRQMKAIVYLYGKSPQQLYILPCVRENKKNLPGTRQVRVFIIKCGTM